MIVNNNVQLDQLVNLIPLTVSLSNLEDTEPFYVPVIRVIKL